MLRASRWLGEPSSTAAADQATSSWHSFGCAPTAPSEHALVAAGCECGILFSTYDLLISSTRPSKEKAAAIKDAMLRQQRDEQQGRGAAPGAGDANCAGALEFGEASSSLPSVECCPCRSQLISWAWHICAPVL